MAQFSYKAISETGRYISGKIAADNPSDLAAILKANGSELVSYKQLRNRSSNSLFTDRIKTQDLISTFIHLEQLDRAGVSIIDSIQDLRQTSDSSKIKDLMYEIHESIKNGSLFSEAIAKRPDTFSPVYVGLIQAGEKTGNLANAFASIIDDLKWNGDIKRKARKATTGPLFGLIMMCLVVGIMTSVVVPKVTGFLLAQNIPLPAVTKSLIAFSNFVKNNWLILLFSGPVMWFTLKILARSEDMAIRIDDMKLRVPVIGQILNKIDSAKFCQFFAITFKSGLGVLDCLDASSSVLTNKAIKRSIVMVKQQVSDGKSLAKSLALTGYFPHLVVRMFKIGEDSGNMESALLNIRFFYEREINDSIDRLVGMIQPTLTIVMGGMMAWITIAVFGPIYGTFSKLN